MSTPVEERQPSQRSQSPRKGGGKRRNRDARREQRQYGAVARELIRAERTNAEQLAVLIERGHGHCAEAQELRT